MGEPSQGELRHWHAVLLSRELKDAPRAVTVCGRELVVFRVGETVGALVDRCPHRGARLSDGKVHLDQLVCPYHGWKWKADGSGRSPGNPVARPCVERFDAVERDGAIYVKRDGSEVAFPAVDVSGYHHVHSFRVDVAAPLEVTLDNFTEVEHTGEIHAVLGYDTDRMDEVVSTVTSTDDAIRVHNIGPQKPMPWALRKLIRLPDDPRFIDDWTTRFSPVHVVYDQYWLDEAGERSPDHLRAVVFFNPKGPKVTELMVRLYSGQPPWGRYGVNALLWPVLGALGRYEAELDKRLIESLADKSPVLRGNQLGRFDKALIGARNRIAKIYRGYD